MDTTSASSASTTCPLNLDRDGSLKSFPQELGERVVAYQRSSDSQGLAHELMLIRHTTPETLVHALDAVSTTLTNDTITWNSLIFKTSDAPHDALPAIVAPLKLWSVLRAAHASGMVQLSWWHRQAWSLGAIGAMGAFMGLFGGLAQRLATLPWSERLITVLTTPVLLSATLLCALMGGWGALLLSRALQQGNKKLKQALARSCSQHAPAPQFLDHIGKELLTLSLPLALIVEDFASLDSFSRAALIRLLGSEQHTRIGLVVWVVFEHANAPSSLLASLNPQQESPQLPGGVNKRTYTMRLQPKVSES